MTAPPARPHMGFRHSSHFSIIAAAQSNADWAEDDAWDSGSDDDKPLAPPRIQKSAPPPTPPKPTRNSSLAIAPVADSPKPTPAPIPFKQSGGPTPLNVIRPGTNVSLRKPVADASTGTPNSISSNAELSFSYTHVNAPSPSSYPSANLGNGAVPVDAGGTTPASTTDEGSRESVEVSSPNGARGRGWMFIKGHKHGGPGKEEEEEREREGYRRWEMSASGSVDFGGMVPDAPDSEDSDGEAMIVGDLDVDIDGETRGRETELQRGKLEFVRTSHPASEERTRASTAREEGPKSVAVEDVLKRLMEMPREKQGIEAIRDDADAIVADPFSILRRADPYGHESVYNNKPTPSRQNTMSPPVDSPSKRAPRTSTAEDQPPSLSSLSRGRSIRTNRRHSQFVECLSAGDINMVELKKLAWSGVPAHLRPMVWPLLLGYIPLPSSTRLQVLQRKREEYKNLVRIAFGRGREGLDQQIWHQIKIDVPRTRPGVRLWMEPGTHQSLERILYVWAIRHPASGYVQGINDLVTPFYQIFLSAYIDADPENYDPSCLPPHILNAIEADSFWCLSRLLNGIQDNYIAQQPGIHRSVKRMAGLVKRIDAPLATHLESQSVEFMQFAFRWMNCLLMREISVKNTIRMWDTYLAEGADSFSQFHLYVCSAFLVKWSEQLKAMDFQGIIMFLQALPTQTWTDHEVELLLSEAFLLSSVWQNAQSHFG